MLVPTICSHLFAQHRRNTHLTMPFHSMGSKPSWPLSRVLRAVSAGTTTAGTIHVNLVDIHCIVACSKGPPTSCAPTFPYKCYVSIHLTILMLQDLGLQNN
jgi:hypothetical protein